MVVSMNFAELQVPLAVVLAMASMWLGAAILVSPAGSVARVGPASATQNIVRMRLQSIWPPSRFDVMWDVDLASVTRRLRYLPLSLRRPSFVVVDRSLSSIIAIVDVADTPLRASHASAREKLLGNGSIRIRTYQQAPDLGRLRLDFGMAGDANPAA
jgi:hypothetical protein